MINVVREPEPKPGTLGKRELYALAVGQVIGAGVITLIVPAIAMTGYSAWLAYFTAIIVGFIMIAPSVFISSTLRLGGGQYSMLADLAGPKFSGVFAFVYLTQCLSLSLFGTSAAAYLGDIFPILGGPVARVAIGALLLTFFYVINMAGVDIMAGAQKLMTWLLIAALFLFAVVGLIRRVNPIFDVSDPQFLTDGWGIRFNSQGQMQSGFITAVLLFLYSCSGYSMTTAYGRDSKNAKKDIPFAMLITVPTLIVLYVGVAMAGAGVMSLEEYGNSTTLVFAAQRVFPTWLFILFIIGGPIMALLSTLNSSFAYNAITIGQSCDDGWLPVKFGEKNSRNARKWILTFMYVVGVVPVIFGLSITTITNMIQLITGFFGVIYTYGYWQLPKKYPVQWKKSWLHLPDGLYYTICVLSLVVYIVVIWKSCLSMTPGLAAANVIVIVVMAGIGLWRAKTGNITIHTSVWTGEELEAEEAGEEKK